MAIQADAIITVDDSQAMAMLAATRVAASQASIAAWERSVIAPYFQQRTAQHFAAESSDIGRWSSLAEATVRIREARGFPGEHPILVRTGDFQRWLETNYGDWGGAGSFRAPQGASGGTWRNAAGDDVGTVDYISRFYWPGKGNREEEQKLQTHQRGARARNNRAETPARPPVTVNGSDFVHVITTLNTWVASVIAANMGMRAVFV